jgi:site-specific recombinase XerD
VLHGKGDKARLVAIDGWALTEIDLWITIRARWKVPPSATLFCASSGAPLDTSHVRRMLPGLARKAGIAKRVHAHGLRHTFAVRMREEGMDIGFISHQLGHSDIATTVRYIRHVAPTDAIQAVHAIRWSNPSLKKPSSR